MKNKLKEDAPNKNKIKIQDVTKKPWFLR